MFEAMPHMGERFHLNFVQVEQDPDCLGRLKRLAERIASGCVTLRDPVSTMPIVPTIARFDPGLVMYSPANYNVQMTLPNKFFEAINAGLGVLVGPLPAIIAIVDQYECGGGAPDFDPHAARRHSTA
jgi:hypothetical protein